jgi:adenosine deaminase
MIIKFFLMAMTIASIINTAFINTALAQTKLAQTNTAETEIANHFASIQNDPGKLLVFLQAMPKGGDLHYHHQSGGGSMAENLIRYGHGEHFCIHPANDTIYQNTHCSKEYLLDNVPLNSALYNTIINAWSMRNFYPINESGHDHFFAVFAKINAIAEAHNAEILAETRNRAGEQNESYLELMVIPDGNASGMLGKKIGWNPDFSVMRKTLLTHGLNNIVVTMQKNMTLIESKEKNILACGTLQAMPGCQVTVRYLYEALREQPPEQVFAQLLAAFEIANNDPRFVGINLVQPEDGYISMRDYHLHMEMIGFLHHLYPNVPISLHAGELNSNIVPPEGLHFHIREAVEIAHAERIGHGVDIAFETNADDLLKEMANKHILVEINLSSNDAVLNVKNEDHPLPLYMSYHVPIALSTDDEGIIRTTRTLEYQKAILRYHLSYATIKEWVRNSINYSFLPGKSIWKDTTYQHLVTDCATDVLGSKSLSSTCRQFIETNEKAKMQWDLENRFLQFENQMGKTL